MQSEAEGLSNLRHTEDAGIELGAVMYMSNKDLTGQSLYVA